VVENCVGQTWLRASAEWNRRISIARCWRKPDIHMQTELYLVTENLKQTMAPAIIMERA